MASAARPPARGPDGVKVQNVDLSVLLKSLSYHTVRASRDHRR